MFKEQNRCKDTCCKQEHADSLEDTRDIGGTEITQESTGRYMQTDTRKKGDQAISQGI